MNVFDASALLAYLQGEDGSEIVEQALTEGGTCSAVNWSEVAQKVMSKQRSWELSRSLLLSFPLHIEPLGVEDAELAATKWATNPALSLGDRICLALGERLDATVITADAAWGTGGRLRQIRP